MGLFSKIFSHEPVKTPLRQQGGEENVLVISDIHLGEDVLAKGPAYLADYIQALNRELAAFIRWHGINTKQDRSWHLIINGDMFDFVKVSLSPMDEKSDPNLPQSIDQESTAPLPNTVENVVWKLQRILEIHRPLFKELAQFIMHGHRVTIIEGNHDTEFYFDEVQETLCKFIVTEGRKICRRQGTEQHYDAAMVANSLTFRPWFEASLGRYHIEHGHQYDEFSSFEYNLSPIDSHDDTTDTIATPMSHKIMPYFVDILGDFSTHGIDNWTLKDWGAFLFAKGPKLVFIIIRVYFIAMWDLLRSAGDSRKDRLKTQGNSHRKRLQTLAESSPYGYQTLLRLDQLKANPAEYSILKMMNLFYFDRFVVLALLIPSLLYSLSLGGVAGLSLAGSTLSLSALSLWLMSLVDGHDQAQLLRKAAAKVAECTGARYIVFGHSHVPELVDLSKRSGASKFGEQVCYLNGGSWVTREILLGAEGDGMTYVVIEADGARLKKWNGPDKEALIIQSTTDT